MHSLSQRDILAAHDCKRVPPMKQSLAWVDSKCELTSGGFVDSLVADFNRFNRFEEYKGFGFVVRLAVGE